MIKIGQDTRTLNKLYDRLQHTHTDEIVLYMCIAYTRKHQYSVWMQWNYRDCFIVKSERQTSNLNIWSMYNITFAQWMMISFMYSLHSTYSIDLSIIYIFYIYGWTLITSVMMRQIETPFYYLSETNFGLQLAILNVNTTQILTSQLYNVWHSIY